MHDLFRREALEAKSNTFLDSTVLRPPFSFAAWAAIRAVVASIAPHPGILIKTECQEGRIDSRSLVGLRRIRRSKCYAEGF